MVDKQDLKSCVRKGVRVRVPLPALFLFSGCSSDGLERTVWDRKVVGSSPTTPTKLF